MSTIALKQCQNCGGWWDPEVAFGRKNFRRYAHLLSGTKPVCLLCEQTARDAKKQGNRWAVKIRDTIRRHAMKLGMTVALLEEQFGWSFDRMIHEAQHAYENGCVYCGESFKKMGHGITDLTLDIVDPGAPPYYITNVRWACATCNREKSKTPPALWARKRVYQEAWKRLEKSPIQPKLGGLLWR